LMIPLHASVPLHLAHVLFTSVTQILLLILE
jgi:hypothetical protein